MAATSISILDRFSASSTSEHEHDLFFVARSTDAQLGTTIVKLISYGKFTAAAAEMDPSIPSRFQLSWHPITNFPFYFGLKAVDNNPSS